MRPGELIVDSFAGGGGASLGIQWALGRSPDIAINHDKEAIALHAANHPESLHLAEDVWKVDPVTVCAGRPVGLMWLSPDCKHFSKAKGGKPVSKKIRGLAWVAIRWAAAVRPRVIVLENVEEFQTWGPVLRDTGMPCKERKGQTFRAFVRKLQRFGYVVEHRELRACDYGAPTIRKRLFLIARCDDQPIVWPTPTYGKGRAHPWRTAAECIDWSIACPSIFLTSEEAKKLGIRRPLAPATMRRIARGIKKFVIDNPKPFIVRVAHGDQDATGKKRGKGEHSIDEPLPTVLASREFALVAPFLKPRYGEDPDPSRRGGLGQAPRVRSLEEPIPVIVPTGNGGDLVAAFLAKHYGGHETPGAQLDLPISTVTTQDHHHPVDSPLPTITSDGGGHASLVASFLTAYYGNEKDGRPLTDPMPTVVSKDRIALVTVNSVEYVITDVGMRMLIPRELYRAQGFPDSYVIDIKIARERKRKGKAYTVWVPLPKTAQVRMVGNSVPPEVADAILKAVFGAEIKPAEIAA